MSAKRDIGVQVLAWWRANLSARTPSGDGPVRVDQTAARGLSARLRRGCFPDVLFEPATQQLRCQLNLNEHELKRFSHLLILLGEIREHDPRPLASLLGGAGGERLLSHMRFKQLVSADDDKRLDLLRRALGLTGGRCNVARLAWDMILWNDQVRTRWCLDYFDSEMPEEKED